MDIVMLPDKTEYFNQRLEEDATRKIIEVNKYINKSIVLFGNCREHFSVNFYIPYTKRYNVISDPELYNLEDTKRLVYYDREKERFAAYESRLMVTERISRIEEDAEVVSVPNFVSTVEIRDPIRRKKCLKLGREVQEIDASGYDTRGVELEIHKENPYLKRVDGVVYTARNAYIDEIIGLSLEEANALFLKYARNGNSNYVVEYKWF